MQKFVKLNIKVATLVGKNECASLTELGVKKILPLNVEETLRIMGEATPWVLVPP